MKISFEIDPDKKDTDTIYEGLVEFNKPHFGYEKLVNFACFLQDEEDHVCGGATGEIADDMAFIWLFWVDEKYRGGVGKKIMKLVEEQMKAQHVKEIHLDTYSFQAPEFYNKIGFKEVSRMLVNKARNIEKIFFIKEL